MLMSALVALLAVPSTLWTQGAQAPVEFIYLGLTADKEHVRYRVKITTDKPVEQVDIGLRYVDKGGKVVEERVIWQNIVRSKRQPIVKGETYDAESYVPPEATRVECKLLRVVFKDFSTWSPPARWP